MIEIKGLSKRFDKVRAIEDITLHVQKGEIFGLVGPDGAGKTTLMRMICDLITPNKGEIKVFGLTAEERGRKKKAVHLGYMPQRFSLYGDLTIIENLMFFGSMYNLTKETIIARSDEILELTNLIEFKNRLADNLSGGMKQKLALTCALVTRPKLLILDEPTYGVDPESRKEFWKILYTLNRNGITILVSTPYMDEAELCTRVAFIDKGQIAIIDQPINLKENFPYEVIELISDANNPDIFNEKEIVMDSSLYGDKYRLIVKPTDCTKEILTRTLEEQGYTLLSYQKAVPSMEDVFIIMAGAEG